MTILKSYCGSSANTLKKTYSIVALNESAAVVSFGNSIDLSVNQKVISLHRSLQHHAFQGFIESVPAYSSLAVFYNPCDVALKGHQYAFQSVEEFMDAAVSEMASLEAMEKPVIEIPVWYEGEDLAFVAASRRLTPDEVVTVHTSRVYQVFMLGFLPGFPYMGTVDAGIATPRKSSPRTHVPAGSVGIAGMQTGIYPQHSPGGWQLIGKTPLKIFDKQKANPCLLVPGDSVRFHAIDQKEFEKRNEY